MCASRENVSEDNSSKVKTPKKQPQRVENNNGMRAQFTSNVFKDNHTDVISIGHATIFWAFDENALSMKIPWNDELRREKTQMIPCGQTG